MNVRQPALERAGWGFAIAATGLVALALIPFARVGMLAQGTQGVANIVAFAVVVLGSMILPAIIGILAAAYVSEFCPPRLRSALMTMLECLVVVPGFAYSYGASVLPTIPLLRDKAPIIFVALGVGAPTVALLTLHVLRSVPAGLRDAATALGASKIDAFLVVLGPLTRRAIAGVCVFSAVRVFGEAIALTFFSEKFFSGIAFASSVRFVLKFGAGIMSVLAYRLLRQRRFGEF